MVAPNNVQNVYLLFKHRNHGLNFKSYNVIGHLFFKSGNSISSSVKYEILTYCFIREFFTNRKMYFCNLGENFIILFAFFMSLSIVIDNRSKKDVKSSSTKGPGYPRIS